MESYKLILEAVGRFIKPSPKAKFHLDGVEMRLMKNKKLSGSFYHEAAAHSLFRIAKLASIKDVKGVSQDDFDALIGL
jgi:hypothetical protein